MKKFRKVTNKKKLMKTIFVLLVIQGINKKLQKNKIKIVILKIKIKNLILCKKV